MTLKGRNLLKNDGFYTRGDPVSCGSVRRAEREETSGNHA